MRMHVLELYKEIGMAHTAQITGVSATLLTTLIDNIVESERTFMCPSEEAQPIKFVGKDTYPEFAGNAQILPQVPPRPSDDQGRVIYTAEFKTSAVDEYMNTCSYVNTAKKFGVSVMLLKIWVMNYTSGRDFTTASQRRARKPRGSANSK
jgi:hypothetical protein